LFYIEWSSMKFISIRMILQNIDFNLNLRFKSELWFLSESISHRVLVIFYFSFLFHFSMNCMFMTKDIVCATKLKLHVGRLGNTYSSWEEHFCATVTCIHCIKIQIIITIMMIYTHTMHKTACYCCSSSTVQCKLLIAFINPIIIKYLIKHIITIKWKFTSTHSKSQSSHFIALYLYIKYFLCAVRLSQPSSPQVVTNK
jgi:hypothetical protein